MHLYKDSKSAFPSQERIAEFSGLSSKSVRRHLEAATKKGWLKRQKNQRRGKVGIWYQYFPTIPRRLRKHIPRMDTVSHREQDRPDILSHRPDTVSLTSGQNRPIDRTPCPPNQGLNQDFKQVLNPEPTKATGIVVNDFPGVEWAEAIAAGKALGIRPPLKSDTPKKYLALVNRYRDRKPPKEITDIIAPAAARMRMP
jgi:DNA-binding MarR family transcriptional regulator